MYTAKIMLRFISVNVYSYITLVLNDATIFLLFCKCLHTNSFTNTYFLKLFFVTFKQIKQIFKGVGMSEESFQEAWRRALGNDPRGNHQVSVETFRGALDDNQSAFIRSFWLTVIFLFFNVEIITCFFNLYFNCEHFKV